MKDEKKYKMEKPMTLEELSRKIHEVMDACMDCPHKLGCEPFSRVNAAEMNVHQRQLAQAQEQKTGYKTEEVEEDPFDENDLPVLDALNKAIADLVDSLFHVADKVQDARRYLKQLDDLTDAALDYLSAIGVPQLAQEE